MLKRVIAALTVLAVYFGLLLIPEWLPRFGASKYFFFYILSLIFVLPVLLLLALLACAWVLVVWRRGGSIKRKNRVLIAVPLAGLLMFALSWLLVETIQGALPTGSYSLDFDQSTWNSSESVEYVRGDITIRQKMLGSAVEQLKTTQNRRDLEAMLGPSLDSSYFLSSERDLIYMLGSERDSFISIDSEWLLIWLDESGHFQRFDIYTD